MSQFNPDGTNSGMVLLYLDLLGTKAKWHRDGRSAVERAFDVFLEIVKAALGSQNWGDEDAGGIESDSAAFVCPGLMSAATLSRAILTRAFRKSWEPTDARLWIRGAIVPIEQGAALRFDSPLSARHHNIINFRYSSGLLDAISVERAGFRGMRVLVSESLVNETVRAELRSTVYDRDLHTFRRLQHSVYPGRLVSGYVDWLWMAGWNEGEWEQNLIQMNKRMRFSAGDAEEFLQAAATDLVFHEITSIRGFLDQE